MRKTKIKVISAGLPFLLSGCPFSSDCINNEPPKVEITVLSATFKHGTNGEYFIMYPEPVHLKNSSIDDNSYLITRWQHRDNSDIFSSLEGNSSYLYVPSRLGKEQFGMEVEDLCGEKDRAYVDIWAVAIPTLKIEPPAFKQQGYEPFTLNGKITFETPGDSPGNLEYVLSKLNKETNNKIEIERRSGSYEKLYNFSFRDLNAGVYFLEFKGTTKNAGLEATLSEDYTIIIFPK